MSELILGRYELIRPLASGGMGKLLLARQVSVPGFDRLVILKKLLPQLHTEEGFVEAFLDEARVAAQLSHPNIVSLHEVAQTNDTSYIVMEYIHGVDVARLIADCMKKALRIPVHVAAAIGRQAALGLHHAHNATDTNGRPLHVIHRDVSPQNLMVRSDGLVKVVDFGVAKAANRMTRTRTGKLKGKVAYIAPEIVRNAPLDGRVDQFSLGVVLWELCARKRLFKGSNELDTMDRVLSMPVPSLAAVHEDFALIDPIVQRMLKRDPDERFPDCAAAAMALADVVAARIRSADEQAFVASFLRAASGDRLERRMPTTPEIPTAAPMRTESKPGVFDDITLVGMSTLPGHVLPPDVKQELAARNPGPAPGRTTLPAAMLAGAPAPPAPQGPRTTLPSAMLTSPTPARAQPASIPPSAPAPSSPSRSPPPVPPQTYAFPQLLAATAPASKPPVNASNDVEKKK